MALERQLLTKDEPPSHVTAARQLAAAKIEFHRIIDVQPEAVLFTTMHDGREVAWTAWSETRNEGKQVAFYRQTGFPAWPSPYLKDTG